MYIYPHINPIALQLGPLAIHWYGLMYAIGFLGGWALALLRARKPGSGWTKDEVSDLIFYAALGVIIGGRVGYMLFYNLPTFLAQPWSIFKIWQGGMAFHGGLIGVLIAVWFYHRKTRRPYMTIVDFVAPLVPIGLGAGRIGNFINGELWGRVTTVSWGIIYPNAGPLPRHPSELYEFLMEGVLLFIIMWCYSAKPKPRMAVSGMFALCYGLLRIFGECFREPDPQIGFLFGGCLTQGQLLSIPLVIAGVILLMLAYRKPHCQQ